MAGDNSGAVLDAEPSVEAASVAEEEEKEEDDADDEEEDDADAAISPDVTLLDEEVKLDGGINLSGMGNAWLSAL